MRLPPEVREAMQRSEAVSAALVAVQRYGGIISNLNSGSYQNEMNVNGQYDDTTEEWIGYLQADIDALDGGKGAAP